MRCPIIQLYWKRDPDIDGVCSSLIGVKQCNIGLDLRPYVRYHAFDDVMHLNKQYISFELETAIIA